MEQRYTMYAILTDVTRNNFSSISNSNAAFLFCFFLSSQLQPNYSIWKSGVNNDNNSDKKRVIKSPFLRAFCLVFWCWIFNKFTLHLENSWFDPISFRNLSSTLKLWDAFTFTCFWSLSYNGGKSGWNTFLFFPFHCCSFTPLTPIVVQRLIIQRLPSRVYEDGSSCHVCWWHIRFVLLWI